MLLDVNNATDLSLVTAHEAKLKSMPWQSAGAVGVDAKGHFIWGGTYQWNRLQLAEETALQYCATSTGDACRVVFANGEFRAAEFTEIAKRMGGSPVATAREAYLQSLRRPAVETTARTGGRGEQPVAIAPLRD